MTLSHDTRLTSRVFPFGHPHMQQGQLLCMMHVLHKLISQALGAMSMMQSSAISSQITAATAINLSGATD